MAHYQELYDSPQGTHKVACMAHYQELYYSRQGSALHTTQTKSLLIITIYTALSNAQEYIIKQHGDEHL